MAKNPETFEIRSEFLKADENLGLVFGWAMICEIDGEPYVDSQNHHIPPEEMLKASLDFALSERVAKDMHAGPQTGVGAFMFPLTEEIKKAFGIKCDRTGLMWAVKASPRTIEKFKSGEYTGFSIGGRHGTLEPMEVD